MKMIEVFVASMGGTNRSMQKEEDFVVDDGGSNLEDFVVDDGGSNLNLSLFSKERELGNGTKLIISSLFDNKILGYYMEEEAEVVAIVPIDGIDVLDFILFLEYGCDTILLLKPIVAYDQFMMIFMLLPEVFFVSHLFMHPIAFNNFFVFIFQTLFAIQEKKLSKHIANKQLGQSYMC
ncbi:hypothetical protein ACJX0J_030772 [Zea mays]